MPIHINVIINVFSAILNILGTNLFPRNLIPTRKSSHFANLYIININVFVAIPFFAHKLFFTEAGKEVRDRAKLILEEHENLEVRIKEIKASQRAKYIHGYSQTEAQRLLDQATTVADFIHFDSIWEEGSRILEVGCGVGAQTEIIAKKNPTSTFVSIDIDWCGCVLMP